MKHDSRPASGAAAKVPSAGARIADYLLFWLGLFMFGLFCLAWSLMATLLYRLLPRRLGARLGQFAIMAGFRTYLAAMEAIGVFRCDLRALDALRDAGALVIAPNHPSLLDAVVVISRLPRVVCITKAKLWDNLFLGGSVRLAGYIRNDSPLNLVKQGMHGLQDGQQLLIFPEGTRTVDAPVNPLKGGFLLIARRAGVPVQSVFLENNSRFLGKGWPLFRKPPIPVVVTARLGRRFDVPADTHGCLAMLESDYRIELGCAARSPVTAAGA
nr:lysophospholipid acyltransferase family protein [uncultured Rhodopila sp.]